MSNVTHAKSGVSKQGTTDREAVTHRKAESTKGNPRLSSRTDTDIHVVLITADRDDARAVRKVLVGACGASFHFRWLSLFPEDLGWIGKSGETVVLLDLRLPDVGGIGVLDTLLPAIPHVPILVFGSAEDADLAGLAVQRGAQDFLSREELHSYTLPRALRNVIVRVAAEESLFMERERAQVTLESMGDGVVSTDRAGHVTYLNPVAEKMTGWSREEALGRPIGDVFRVVDITTREPLVRNPMDLAIEQDQAVALVANSVLVRRDGSECAVEDSAAPIHSRDGRVIGAVMVFRDVSKVREVALKMSHLAQHDFLTNLANPVLFKDRVTQAIALARRHDTQIAVLFMDLDHFKHVNDSLGHAMGDKLLQAVAHRLKACVRDSDTICRKGGDEFAVLLPEITHVQDAAASADKLIAAMRVAHHIAGQELVVTASIGISFYPRDGTDVETLLSSADAAMYEAKKHGRNQYRVWRQETYPGAVATKTVPRSAHKAA
jgi:diguanylate cyclase (GGDEF)-like protein/PAS domain S-box-containing protein